MGRGIAQVAAQAGYPVRLYDPLPQALEDAHSHLEGIFAMLARKGRLPEEPKKILARLRFCRSLVELQDAAWVIEAAPEDLPLKLELFRELSALCPEALLATNTSTLSITRLAAAAERPELVVGLHFFNPVPLMRLIEVIPGLRTASEVTRRAVTLAESLGKVPVVAADRPGFIVNRVARPYYGEALKLAGEGLLPQDIDRVMRALGFRMGPFELMDLIGLDVSLAATSSVYQAFFQDPRYRPHPRQQAMVDAGLLGRKSGRGFYDYSKDRLRHPGPPPSVSLRPLRARLVGGGALAAALRSSPGLAEEEAEVILDVRVPLTEKVTAAGELPIATLVWGHSASLAAALGPRSMVGMSLLPSPSGVAPVVELFPPLSSDNAALVVARRVFAAAGFEVLVFPDQPGGVGFRILAMLINEAAGAVAERLAAPEAIDSAMKFGVNYPWGPLEWSEFLGLGVVLAGLQGLHAELGEERYRPHPLLRRMVAAGVRSWR